MNVEIYLENPQCETVPVNALVCSECGLMHLNNEIGCLECCTVLDPKATTVINLPKGKIITYIQDQPLAFCPDRFHLEVDEDDENYSEGITFYGTEWEGLYWTDIIKEIGFMLGSKRYELIEYSCLGDHLLILIKDEIDYDKSEFDKSSVIMKNIL